jgi:hypothetical protein
LVLGLESAMLVDGLGGLSNSSKQFSVILP